MTAQHGTCIVRLVAVTARSVEGSGRRSFLALSMCRHRIPKPITQTARAVLPVGAARPGPRFWASSPPLASRPSLCLIPLNCHRAPWRGDLDGDRVCVGAQSFDDCGSVHTATAEQRKPHAHERDGQHGLRPLHLPVFPARRTAAHLDDADDDRQE